MGKRRMAIIYKIIIIVVLISMLQCTFEFGALKVYADSEYESYVVVDGERVAIPETYIVERVINSIGKVENEPSFFKEPLDLCVDQNGYIYVADTGNNRIVKLNPEGKLDAIFRGPEGNTFKSPSGVFVDSMGSIFVADTGNKRIVHLAPDGSFIEEFVEPKSDLLGNVPFSVSKIAVSQTGYIYVMRGENILIMDAYNRFRGFMGQTKIGFSLIEVLTRLFASEEQKKFIAKRLAATYLSMELGPDGMLYATSMDRNEGEIKRLNSVGNNTYRKYGTISDSGNFSLWARIRDRITKGNYITKSFRFGETVNDKGEYFLPIFRDICVDKYGNVTVIEETTGKVYQYDKEGNALAVFGGLGEKKGKFIRPSAIAVDGEGKIYILDRMRNNIQVFKPTYFIQLIHSAVKEYHDGNYDAAYDIWQKVLDIDEDHELAYIGIANTLYKQGRFKESMEAFKIANDREGYSKAFVEYRYEYFREHFLMVVIVLALFVVLVVVVLKKLVSKGMEYNTLMSNGNSKKLNIIEGILFGFYAFVHPAETFNNIKYNREKINLWSGIVIYAAIFVVRILYIMFVHYPLADVDVREANLLFEAMRTLLPSLTWVIGSFAVTSILDGESKLSEIFVTSAYCMLPYVVVYGLLTGVSHALCLYEKGFYSALTNLTTLWILILYFISIKTLNDYKASKAVGTYLLSGIAMLIIMLIGVLLYVLMVRFAQFVGGIMVEIRTNLLY